MWKFNFLDYLKHHFQPTFQDLEITDWLAEYAIAH